MSNTTLAVELFGRDTIKQDGRNARRQDSLRPVTPSLIKTKVCHHLNDHIMFHSIKCLCEVKFPDNSRFDEAILIYVNNGDSFV